MNYDDCPECGTKMTGFTTLFCPKEDEHPLPTKLIKGELINISITHPDTGEEIQFGTCFSLDIDNYFLDTAPHEELDLRSGGYSR